MQILQDLLNNRVLICSIWGWFIAQVIKTLIYMVVNGKFRPERLVGSGGMPSSHASTVCAMATSSLIYYGISSFEFAVCTLLAIIVMHDARGVRRETGKQAVIINELMEWFKVNEGADIFNTKKLKELVGHTPTQVTVGAILGCLIAIIYCSAVG